jgi:hypothetical protein
MSKVQIMPQRQSKKSYMWWFAVLLISIVTGAYLVSWPEIILLRAVGSLSLG